MALDTTIGGLSSDSYATLADWTAFATTTGRTITGTTAEQEVRLRRAALAIEDRYTFRGWPTFEFQALAWPRSDVGMVDGWIIANNVIPPAIKRAQMEMAFALQAGVDPFPVTTGVIGSESSSVGPLSKSVTYLGGKARPAIPAVDKIMQPFLSSGAGMAQVLRA